MPQKRPDSASQSSKSSASASVKKSADSFTPGEETSARIYGLNRYISDARASVQLVKTVKDALGEIDSVLHEMRSLSAQAAGEKMTPIERSAIQKVIDSYMAEIDQIATATELKASEIISGSSNDPSTTLH